MPYTPAPNPTADLLERAAARLEKPGAWTQDYFARTRDQHPIGPLEPNAVCWCAHGAIAAEAGEDGVLLEDAAVGALACRVGSIPLWNDLPTRTQADVVAELRAAAADVRAS